MITAYILGVVLLVVNAVLALLPIAGSLSSGVSAGIVWFAEALNTANAILPVSTMLSVLAALIAFEGVLFGVKALFKIFGMVRGSK